MDEARRRRDLREDAYANGRPQPRPDRCPACRSKRIVFVPADATPSHQIGHGACRDCRAIWEALPALYVADPVAAEPCDNCAFRPGLAGCNGSGPTPRRDHRSDIPRMRRKLERFHGSKPVRRCLR